MRLQSRTKAGMLSAATAIVTLKQHIIALLNLRVTGGTNIV